MPYLNVAVIMGHLGRDAEMRYTNEGNPICEFTVAVSKKWKDAMGNQKEKTAWLKCKCFGGWADNAGKMRKGQLVLVKGELDQDTWEDKDTRAKRERTLIHALEVYALTATKREDGEARPPAPTATTPRPQPKPVEKPELPFPDDPDEVPF